MPERDAFLSPDEEYESAQTTTIDSHDFDIYHVRRVVAGNPNTPKQVLERLAADSMPNIRRRTAENPRTPVDILRRLAEDEHCDVRLAVAENPHTPPDVLAMLGNDPDADVRYGVAENPHMPEDILVKLSDDDNPYVRCRALKTLQMLSPEAQQRLKILLQPGYGDVLGYRPS